ncbi:MAG: DNA-formamidopyrimidine glycosylase family protein [Acidimicrobiales bacterium]
MPERPEVQAMAERVEEAVRGGVVTRVEPLGFTALKTVDPPPEALVGRTLTAVGHRGKFCVLELAPAAGAGGGGEEGEGGDDGAGEGGGALRVAVHLSQAGRVDLERPAKSTRPKGSVVRLVLRGGGAGAAGAGDGAGDGAGKVAGETGLLVREHGTQRKAGWWILAPGDDGPLAGLGPEPDDPAFAELVETTDSRRRLHTWLRDQRVVAGIGRGYADDICHRAGLSPFAAPGSLDAGRRRDLLDAVRSVLDEALAAERRRPGALSEARLGDRHAVHRRAGSPCPRCGEPLLRVSFDTHEVTYCKVCQTGGRALADRRLSRLLR